MNRTPWEGGTDAAGAPSLGAPSSQAKAAPLLLATHAQRIATLILDFAALMLLATAFALVSRLVGEPVEYVGLLFGAGVQLLYYFGFEAAFGRTPGKLVVGTRVVNLAGDRPTLSQILARTLARCAPFEPLSFLGATPVGWHDAWSSTRVIRTRN